jgi:hypothetical protein
MPPKPVDTAADRSLLLSLGLMLRFLPTVRKGSHEYKTAKRQLRQLINAGLVYTSRSGAPNRKGTNVHLTPRGQRVVDETVVSPAVDRVGGGPDYGRAKDRAARRRFVRATSVPEPLVGTWLANVAWSWIPGMPGAKSPFSPTGTGGWHVAERRPAEVREYTDDEGERHVHLVAVDGTRLMTVAHALVAEIARGEITACSRREAERLRAQVAARLLMEDAA